MPPKQKRILFVDDDASLLELLQELMGRFAGDAWEVLTAPDVSRALGILQEQRVDLLVIDIHMPVVDGVQFLSLLQRKYPDVLKVVLTGDATDAFRAACLSNGAELFLEKPRQPDGWRSIHATLHELARFQPEDGFRGVLRRVGLPDVLQMECLARHSVVLRVHAGAVQGRIFVKDGQIVHAQVGGRLGEEALNQLLGLAGGEFDVGPFVEPPERSISGSWEFLLMEAARRRDEAAAPSAPAGHTDSVFSVNAPRAAPVENLRAQVVPVIESGLAPDAVADGQRGVPGEPQRPQVDELLVCSRQGEVLHEWQCSHPTARISLMEFLSQKARQLAQGLPLGGFDRIEVSGGNERLIAQFQGERGLLVRLSCALAEADARSFGA